MTHTPTPWVTAPGDPELDKAKYPTSEKVLVMAMGDCEFHPVADCSCNHTCRFDYDAADNAAFIVEACNAYDSLRASVAALRGALERVYHYWQERYGLDFGKADESLMAEITRVQDCLAALAAHRDEGGDKRE